MADEYKTVIEYDVHDAIDNLHKLDSTVRKSADTADKSFDKVGKSSQNAGVSLGALVRGVSHASFYFNNITTAVSRVITGLNELGGLVVENTFEFERAAKNAADYADELTRVQAIADKLSAIQDAAVVFRYDKAIENLRLEQSARGVRLGEIADEKAQLQTRLRQQQEYYTSLDRVAKDSIRRRQDLEKKAADLLAEIEDRQLIKNAERYKSPSAQVSKLIEGAQALGKRGEFDRSLALLREAETVAEKSGNKVDARRVVAAEKELAGAIQISADRLGEKAKADRAAAAAASETVKQSRARYDALTEEAAAIGLVNKQAREQQRTFQIGKQAEVRKQTRQQAARDLQTDLNALRDVATRYRSYGEKLYDSFSPKNFLVPPDEIKDQQRAINLLDEANARIFNRIAENPTVGAVEDAAPEISKFVAALAKLRGVGNIAPINQFEVDRLSKVEGYYNSILEKTEKIRSAGGDRTTPLIDLTDTTQSAVDITTNTGAIADDTERAAAGAELLNRRFSQAADSAARIKLGNSTFNILPNPGGVQAPAATQPQSATPATPEQNITVNVQVRGGMIDQDTIQQISERVGREIRKGTVQQ